MIVYRKLKKKEAYKTAKEVMAYYKGVGVFSTEFYKFCFNSLVSGYIKKGIPKIVNK